MFNPDSMRPLLLASIPFLVIASVLPGAIRLSAQTQQPPKQKEGMGVSTGTPRAYTSRGTAGVTDPKAPVIFEDVTARTALAGFRHRSGGPEKNYILDVPSGGVAILDYDGDGLPDIYLVN